MSESVSLRRTVARQAARIRVLEDAVESAAAALRVSRSSGTDPDARRRGDAAIRSALVAVSEALSYDPQESE